jgi:hypothetical protein
MRTLPFLFAFAAWGMPADAQDQKPVARFSLEIATKVQPAPTPGQPLRSAHPRSGTWRNLITGESVRIATYMAGQGCGFITGAADFAGNPTFGWRLEATPVSLQPDHAVVRLRWTREFQEGRASGLPASEATVMLRPGDDIALDSALMSMSFPVPGCRGRLATLVVALKEVEPQRERVASTDLWLVHRAPDGRETSQQLNVRGGYNEELPFVFDDLRIGQDTLDISGSVLARTGSGGTVALQFTAERRWSRGTGFPSVKVLGNGGTTFTLKPDDVTSVMIPLVTEGVPMDARSSQPGRDPALLGHSLSIRLRSRQIR